MSSHKHGLALDWITGMTVVLANASIVHASATENPDLFWALRGAGSNFGIVASYEFDTFAAPDEVTYFNVPFTWNKNNGVANLGAMENYTKNIMPSELTMRMYASSYSSYFEGTYYGNVTGLKKALEPFLNSTELSISSAVNTTWLNAFSHYANAATDPTYPYSFVSDDSGREYDTKLTGVPATNVLRKKSTSQGP